MSKIVNTSYKSAIDYDNVNIDRRGKTFQCLFSDTLLSNDINIKNYKNVVELSVDSVSITNLDENSKYSIRIKIQSIGRLERNGEDQGVVIEENVNKYINNGTLNIYSPKIVRTYFSS